MVYITEYEKYRQSQKKSANTISMEVKYLAKFHAFMNVLQKREVPVWDIKYADVVAFFDEESHHMSDRSLYRKVTIISLYFDFLWQNNHIPIDYMAKFRQRYRNLLDWKTSEIKLDYQMMLDKKEIILQSSEINLMPKLIYLLLLRGVTLADMIQLSLENIVVNQSNTTAHIIYETNKDKIERTLIYDSPMEIELIKEGIALAESRRVSTFLSSKIKTDKQYTAFNPANLHDMVKPIESILGFSVSSTNKVMYAYVYHLATVQKKSVDEISQLLGMTIPHTAKVLKSALERMSKVEYNKNIN